MEGGPSGESSRDRRARLRMTAAAVGAAIDAPAGRTRSRRRNAPIRYTGSVNVDYVVNLANGGHYTINRLIDIAGTLAPTDTRAAIRKKIEKQVKRRVRAKGRQMMQESEDELNGQIEDTGTVTVTLQQIPQLLNGDQWDVADIPMRRVADDAIWADAFVRYESDGIRKLTLTSPGSPPVAFADKNCVVVTLQKVYTLSERAVLRAIFDGERRQKKRLADGSFDYKYEYEWEGETYDYLGLGITTKMVSRFAEHYRIPLVAVGLDGEAFYSYTPDNPRKGKSMRTLFFAVSNGHMYFLDHHTKGLIRSFTSNRRVHLLEYKSKSEKSQEVSEQPLLVHLDATTSSDPVGYVAESIMTTANDTGSTVTQLCVSGLDNLSAVLEDLVVRRQFIPSCISAFRNEVSCFSVKSVEGRKVSVRVTKDFELASQIPALRPVVQEPPLRFGEFEGVIPAVYGGESLATFGSRALDRSVALAGISAYASTVSDEAWDRVFRKEFMPRAAYGPVTSGDSDARFDFAVDISKCYASVLSDFGIGGVPLYSAFDRVEKAHRCNTCISPSGGTEFHGCWVTEEQDLVHPGDVCCKWDDVGEQWYGNPFNPERAGFWKVRTAEGAGFPFPRNGGVGWYATPVVEMALKGGLVTHDCIEERYLSSFRLPRDVFAKGVEFILTQFAGLPEAAKAMIMAYGKFATRGDRTSRVYVTCDPVEAAAIIAKNPKASVYPMNVCPSADSFDRVNREKLQRDEALFTSNNEWERVNLEVAMDLCDRGEGDTTRFDYLRRGTDSSYHVYQVHVPVESVYFRTKYPLYCYIVQMGWLKLMEMAKDYESRYNVKWVASKVDCAVFQYVEGSWPPSIGLTGDAWSPDIGGGLGHDESLGLYGNMGRYRRCTLPHIAPETPPQEEPTAPHSPHVTGEWVDVTETDAFQVLADANGDWEGGDVTTHPDWSGEWYSWLKETVSPLVTGDDAKGFLLTGGAGTGKTTLVNSLLDLVGGEYPSYRFIKVAPTNKAALHIRGGTIDKVFGVFRDGEHNGGVSYCERLRRFFRAYPEGETVIVVDEISMCREDHYLTFLIIRAMRPDVKFLLLGDFDQCPPVEPLTRKSTRGEFMGTGVTEREGALFDYKGSNILRDLVGSNRVLLTYSKRFDQQLFDFVNHPSMSRVRNVRLTRERIRFEPGSADSLRWNLRWVFDPEDMCERDVCWTNASRKFSNWWHNSVRTTDAFRANATYQALEVQEDTSDPFTQNMIVGRDVPLIAMKAWKAHDVVKNTTWKVTKVTLSPTNAMGSLVRLRPDGPAPDLLTGQNNQDGSEHQDETHEGPASMASVIREIEITAGELRSYFLLAYCLTTHRLQGDTLRELRVGIWDADELATRGKFKVLYTMLTRATALNHLFFYDKDSGPLKEVVAAYMNENPNAVNPFHRGFVMGGGLGDDEQAVMAQQGMNELHDADDDEPDEEFDDIE